MKTFGFLSHLDLNLYLFRSPIMKELIRRGHTVYAICPKGDKNQSLETIGCHVINYEIDRKGLNPFNEKIAINNIYHAVKDLGLDLIHTFTAKPNIYGTIAAQKASVPIILNLVEGLGSFYTKNTLKNILIRKIMERLYKKTFKTSQGCVFVNNDDPQYMLKNSIISNDKIKIIKSVGIDTKKFTMTSFSNTQITTIKKDNNLQDKIIVLMVARAIWDKGIKEYYETASILTKKYKHVEFILVGDTDEGNHTSASKEFLQNGHVTWLGHRDDIVELTAISDIYVLPSYREGLPATLMEAASMSKPIVTTDTVGCREVVENGYNGFLVPVKNCEQLSSKVETLILDEPLRKKMGSNGRQKVLEEFDIDIVLDQYIHYYNRFIKC
jgi:N,N'-diacetylbacillosaminyl-diphospho-undecaprenol alpha-1,3-N-acetylgalactosaminyltransferase